MEKKFLEFTHLLSKNRPIWENEPLDLYPFHLDSFPVDWVKQLSTLSDEKLYLFEGKEQYQYVQDPQLQSLLLEISQLCQVPKMLSPQSHQLDQFAFHGVKAKKRHELEHLVPIMVQIIKDHQLKGVVDIGSGLGHLSQALARYYKIPTTCIESNPLLKTKAQKRIRRPYKIDYPLTQYLQADLNLQSSELTAQLKGPILNFGLHTCGELAVVQMQLATRYCSKAILNFGCCYHRIKSNQFFNISSLAKTDGLMLTPASLTLAAKAHKNLTLKEFLFRQRVKSYRYGLDQLLKKEFALTHAYSVGPSSEELYYRPFSVYCAEQLKRLKLKPTLTEKAVNSFYQIDRLAQERTELMSCGIIRSFFGRLLEFYLLYDRALYLQENRYQAEVKSYFNRHISPRNIGIFASL